MKEMNCVDAVGILAVQLGRVWCDSRVLQRYLQGSLREKRIFGALLFCAFGAMALSLEHSGVPYILCAVLRFMLLTVLAEAVFHGDREKKLLAVVLLTTMTRLIWTFVESFLCLNALVIVHRATGGKQMFLGQRASQAVLLATYLVGITAVNLSSKGFEAVFAAARKSWQLCLAFPLGCVTFLTDLANWAASRGIMVQSRGGYDIYKDQLFSHGAMCVFTGLAMAASGFFVLGMDRIRREEEARDQYRFQAMYYKMAKEQYSQLERLRHDMKNHMIALENLVQNRCWEQASSYLRELETVANMEAGEEATGSPVLDALLSRKKRQAADSGVRWQCDARLPRDLPVKEMDLCIIAGNILDNAAEACERLPQKQGSFIQVSIGTVKKCLLLEVKNTADLADIRETLQSRKADSAGHGMGLANVRAAVSRYNGAVHMEAEKGVFTISVLLPLCQES